MKIKKVLALFLVLTMVATMFTVSLSTVVEADTSAQSKGYVFDVEHGIKSTLNKYLYDNGNGTYTYRLQTGAFLRNVYETEQREFPKNDVVNVTSEGYYLLELWGGDGGKGGDALVYKPGEGGNGGYVYGVVYLTAGQAVVFNVGSNGITTKSKTSGQGVNGDGGTHGENGRFEVGAGGGYSAIYLFNTPRATAKVTEEERMSNYIMIAGGGGGGGAGNQAGFNPKEYPDGGYGGDILKSASGHLSISDNNVAGTYFVGRDGQTSGDNNSTAGRGGSNVPGAIVSTSGGSYTSSTIPNNWTASAVEATTPGELISSGGAGGSGNFRGGAGGSGFCGGSGGVMRAALIGANVGGGGGGSSFVADSVLWDGLPTTLTDMLLGSDYASESGMGILTYLGDTYEVKFDTSYYSNCTLAGNISKYFEILKVECTDKDANISYNSETGAVSITNIDIEPDIKGFMSNECSVNIMLKPRSTFAGGNRVPVLKDNQQFTMKPQGTSIVNSFVANEDCDFLNIPLQFDLTSSSYTDASVRTYYVSDLYSSSLDSIDLSSWEYDYIESVSDVIVVNRTTGDVVDISGTVTPTETTKYDIKCTVVPKYTTPSKVGTAVEPSQEYKAVSTIAILSEDEAKFGDTIVKANKKLSYSNGAYNLGISAKQQTGWMTVDRDPGMTSQTFDYDHQGTWNVPVDGWYYIQLWGANGGAAGKIDVTYTLDGFDMTANGCDGAEGGSVFGYVHLEEGQTTNIVIGLKGTDQEDMEYEVKSNDRQYISYNREGTEAGKRSEFDIGGTHVMVAGGGSGAGGASFITRRSLLPLHNRAIDAAPGAKPSVYASTYASIVNATAGTQGTCDIKKDGVGVAPYYGGEYNSKAGTTGQNYFDSSVMTSTMPDELQGKGVTLPSSDRVNGAEGGARITLLRADFEDETEYSPDDINTISISGRISKYFDVNSLGLNIADATPQTSTSGGAKVVEYSRDGAVIGRVTYTLSTLSDGSTDYSATINKYTYETIYDEGNKAYTNDAELVLNITPKSGFMGGNDVPLITYNPADTSVDSKGKPNRGVKVTKDSSYLYVVTQNATDFVNVSIEDSVQDEDITTDSVRIAVGDSVDLNTLYSVDTSGISNDWRADFVDVTMPSVSTVSPTETTDYPVEVVVSPKADATKAVVIESVGPYTASDTITVFVDDYSIDFALSHLKATGDKAASRSEDSYIILTADEGYLLPDTISVQNASYTYDKSTGRITLSNPTDTVIITASGAETTYSLRYLYEDWNGSEYVVRENIVSNLHKGDVITSDFVNSVSADAIAHVVKGYEYTWDWVDMPTDGSGNHIMPGQNWEVYGSYAPITSSLTINYYQKGTTTPMAERYHLDYVPYDTEYSIVSPIIAGYVASLPVVSGNKDDHDEVINVYYSTTKQAVYISYIYGLTGKMVDESLNVEQEYSTGASYSFDSPTITGYTPDKANISGTMGPTGAVYYVYYYPNEYKVTFDADGGSLGPNEGTRYVYYGMEFGYDADTGKYVSLPVPTKANSSFTGWKLGDDTIEYSTMFNYTENVTLVAQWELNKYKILIDYRFDDDSSKNYIETKSNIPYGQAYSYDVPVVSGYNSDKTVVSGTMGASDIRVTVNYTKQEEDKYTLVIHYVYPTGTTAAPDYTKTYTSSESKAYSVVSPTVTNFTPDIATVSGTLTEKYKVVTVTYSPNFVDSAVVEFKDGTTLVKDYSFTPGSTLTDALVPKVPSTSTGYFKGWDTSKQLLVLDFYDKNKTFSVTDTTDQYTVFKTTYYSTKYDTANFGLDKISDAKAQAVVLSDGTKAIRFLALVDSNYADYEEAGFVITDKYTTPTKEAGYQYSQQSTIYKKLLVTKSANDEGTYSEAATMTDFSIDGVGILYTNLPVDTTVNANKIYYATPYLKLKNGSYVYGNTKAAYWNDLT